MREGGGREDDPSHPEAMSRSRSREPGEPREVPCLTRRRAVENSATLHPGSPCNVYIHTRLGCDFDCVLGSASKTRVTSTCNFGRVGSEGFKSPCSSPSQLQTSFCLQRKLSTFTNLDKILVRAGHRTFEKIKVHLADKRRQLRRLADINEIDYWSTQCRFMSPKTGCMRFLADMSAGCSASDPSQHAVSCQQLFAAVMWKGHPVKASTVPKCRTPPWSP